MNWHNISDSTEQIIDKYLPTFPFKSIWLLSVGLFPFSRSSLFHVSLLSKSERGSECERRSECVGVCVYYNVYTYYHLFHDQRLKLTFFKSSCGNCHWQIIWYSESMSFCLRFNKKKLTVCLSTRNFNISHDFWILSNRTCIFHVCMPYGKIFFVVPRSRSSVNVIVKYQGHFWENGC